MIKSLRDARMTDVLPRIVGSQAWAKALSEAVGIATEKILRFTDQSQIYTALDVVSEEVLDTLAVNWKVEWYDTDMTEEQKRRTIQTAVETQRLMGTPRAVRLQASAVHPGSTVEEWFDYGGKIGYFRVLVDLTGAGITEAQKKSLLRGIEQTKNLRSRLEELDYVLRPDDEERRAGSIYAGGGGAIHTRMRVPEGGRA